MTDHGCVCCRYIQIAIRLIISHYLNLNNRNWIAVINAPATVEKGDQAINWLSQLEKIEKTQSLRKLARLGFEYYVAKNYRDGRISLRNAADLLNLNLSETIDLLSEAGVKGNIRASDVVASL